jgi:hypothetical protein
MNDVIEIMLGNATGYAWQAARQRLERFVCQSCFNGVRSRWAKEELGGAGAVCAS